MTTIVKDDYIFTVDIDETKKYYSTHSLCDCECCRNLYAQIKAVSSKLDAYLSEFGVDICRPDEAASIKMKNYIDYLFVGYTVTGVMETHGIYETDIDDFHVTISRGDNAYEWFPNEQKEPCFFVSISNISLPWVLDEPFPKINRLRERIKSFFSNSDR